MVGDAARGRLSGWGIDPWPGGDLPALLATTHPRWGRVVREAGMRLDQGSAGLMISHTSLSR